MYVELPVDPCYGEPEKNRNVCATACGGALKFVNVFPRCCCGRRRADGAYVINTWTLRMSDMEWVRDAMVDATELWALDAYKGLPRVPLSHPVVSMDEPYVICFVLAETDEETYDQMVADEAGDSILQSSCETKLSVEPAVKASEILAVLQEIPSYGLDRDDMLKTAYRVLNHGDGHRFRSLLSLPTDLRKPWLLMEIKASEI
ncbi:hypothetical protein HU200_029098 [Digitaria exilis]|uniref:DUF1618 domain-containing protein n=1 Tax=Digitaria exilis TaxID=1010633 RepID=A0A835C1V2_9POAL|nr:hypothetical protein HU200_029098 [Digitaria exilis]